MGLRPHLAQISLLCLQGRHSRPQSRFLLARRPLCPSLRAFTDRCLRLLSIGGLHRKQPHHRVPLEATNLVGRLRAQDRCRRLRCNPTRRCRPQRLLPKEALFWDLDRHASRPPSWRSQLVLRRRMHHGFPYTRLKLPMRQVRARPPRRCRLMGPRARRRERQVRYSRSHQKRIVSMSRCLIMLWKTLVQLYAVQLLRHALFRTFPTRVLRLPTLVATARVRTRPPWCKIPQGPTGPTGAMPR